MMRAAFMTINPLSSLIAAAMLLQMASACFGQTLAQQSLNLVLEH